MASSAPGIPEARCSGRLIREIRTGRSGACGSVRTVATTRWTQWQPHSGLLDFFDSSWNIHGGVTGGQIFASGAETTGLGKLDLSQNFLGGYAVATRGAFFADVTVRRDWYDAKPVLPMIEQNTDFSGRGYGVVATLGYNFRLNNGYFNGYFIEPQVGLHLTRANFDTVNLPADQQMGINSVNSTLFRA